MTRPLAPLRWAFAEVRWAFATDRPRPLTRWESYRVAVVGASVLWPLPVALAAVLARF